MEVLFVKDKWDTYVKADERGVHYAALDLLRQRYDEGFWYDESDELEQDYIRQILKNEDGKEALQFLYDRRDYEYEWVEVQQVKGIS